VNEAVDVDPSRARYERGDFRLTLFRAAITARLYMAVQPGPAGDIRPVLDEYIRVLAYPKFKLVPAEIRALIEEEFLPFAETVNVIPSTVPSLRDADDAKFITCATTAGVRWLVSGDDDLLSLRRPKSVEIVSVTTFLQHVRKRS
jgi:predicted nucleic acid-binding protein